jgi:predicted ATPase/DNA-binding SARP family transcriptional activator
VSVVADDGSDIPIPAAMRRALLAVLLLNRGRPMSARDLVTALWEDPPPAAVPSLHAHISRLRRDLGGGPVRRQGGGYVLDASPDDLDVTRFERLLEEGRVALGDGRFAGAATTLRECLGLWSGAPLAGVADAPLLAVEARRLSEERLEAEELLAEAELELGHHAELVGLLERRVVEEPHRERRWALLMLALYRSGRQAEALAAYHRVRQLLDEELGVDPSPELQALEMAILRQDPSLDGPAARPRRPSVRLLSPSNELIGREQQASEVEGLVRARRLVTLVGPGGVGKTRLAVEVAHRLTGEFPAGVIFIDLSAVRDPELVLSTVGQETGGGGQPWEAILDRRMLLVVDNLEQVLDAAPRIAQLHERCPSLHLLATSRAPLRISGEQQYEVPTLSVADSARLFEERARETLAAWRPDPDVASAALGRLDGLPLAIELTAARVKVLPPDALASGPALDIMSRGRRDAPARHRTLRDTIAWSYSLLEPDVRGAFRGLSVFAGGFDTNAAGEVAGARLDALSELVDHSLVRRAGERLAMLETIREFAAEEARSCGETVEVAGRHLAHFAELMREVRRSMARNDDFDRWMSVCAAERDNLRVAFDHALATRDVPAAHDLCTATWTYWLVVGAMEEGERWAQAYLDLLPPDAHWERANTMVLLAEYPRWSGAHERAIRLRREALTLMRQTDDPELRATLLDDLASSLGAIGRLEEAEAAVEEALRLRSERPDEVDELIHTNSALAELRLRQGRPDEALALAQSMREQDELRKHSTGWRLETTELLANALLHLGRRDEAADVYETLITEATRADFKIVLLPALVGLADAIAARKPERASALLDEAERLHQESRIAYWDPSRVEELRSRVSRQAGDVAREIRS